MIKEAIERALDKKYPKGGWRIHWGKISGKVFSGEITEEDFNKSLVWPESAGVPKPSLASLKESIEESLVDIKKSEKVQQIKKLAFVKSSTNFSFNGELYDIGHVSQTIINQVHCLALSCLSGNGDWPEDFEWVTSNNSRVPMSAEQFNEFANAITLFKVKTALSARKLKDGLSRLSSVSAVEQFDEKQF